MAEVHGQQRDLDQTDESDDHINSDEICICQPCNLDGKQNPAKSYCEDCKDYLCILCCNDHKKFKVLGHHKLTDITEAPVVTQTQQGSKPTINCNVHPDKLIEYVCQTHNQLLCGICVITKHTSCMSAYIPDVSLGFIKSDQYREIKVKLETLLNHVIQSSMCANDNIKAALESQERLIAELEQYREEIVRCIDQGVRELKDTIKNLYDDCLHNLRKVKCDLDDFEREIKETKKHQMKLEEQSSDLYIACQMGMARFEEIQNQINDKNINKVVRTYRLEWSTVSKELLYTKWAIGGLVEGQNLQQMSPSVVLGKHTSSKTDWDTCQVLKQTELKATFPGEKSKCRVTSLELLEPDVLLLADFANSCIKQIATDTSTMIGYLTLSGQPWDLKVLPNNRAVVTTPFEKKIHFINTKEHLSLLHPIKVKGQCRGICSTKDDKLVVSYDKPAKVEVLDERGTVLSTINGKDLFSEPLFVCVATENSQELIFVSDSSCNTLSKLTMSGEVLSTYNDQELQGYYGVTAVDDHLLICGLNSHTVHVISTNMKKVRTLMSGRDRARQQSSVCFDSERRKLYVGCLNGSIKVYNIIYQLE